MLLKRKKRKRGNKMTLLNDALRKNNVSSTLDLDQLQQFHIKQLDFRSYATNHIDFAVFQVVFSYASNQGRCKRTTSKRTFFINFSKLSPCVEGLNSERYNRYFETWAKEQKHLKSPSVLSIENLGCFHLQLDAFTEKSLWENLLCQNKGHVRFDQIKQLHPKNLVIDVELSFYMYWFSYEYETNRRNKKMTEKIIFTLSEMPQEMHEHMLSISHQVSFQGKEFRSLSNVKILESRKIGNLLISA